MIDQSVHRSFQSFFILTTFHTWVKDMAISAAGFLIYLFLYFCVNINHSSWVVHIDMEYGHVSLVHVGWKLVGKWINSLICWVVPVYSLDQIVKVSHRRSTYFHKWIILFPQSPYPFTFDTLSWTSESQSRVAGIRVEAVNVPLSLQWHSEEKKNGVFRCALSCGHSYNAGPDALSNACVIHCDDLQESGRRAAWREKSNIFEARNFRRGSPMFLIKVAGTW